MTDDDLNKALVTVAKLATKDRRYLPLYALLEAEHERRKANDDLLSRARRLAATHRRGPPGVASFWLVAA